MGLYFNRPASELVFVTRSMHKNLHREMCSNGGKIGGKKTGAINGKKGAIKQSIPILQFTKDGTFVKEWSSLSEAEHKLGIPHSSICACLRYGRKHAGGFVWRYASSSEV